MDNLNTHTIGSLYETFPAEEAKRLKNKLEIHYTPKHGSWLNMAEIEINMIVNHGISKRVANMKQMKSEVAAWNKRRNKSANKINWRFTTADARIFTKRIPAQLQLDIKKHNEQYKPITISASSSFHDRFCKP